MSFLCFTCKAFFVSFFLLFAMESLDAAGVARLLSLPVGLLYQVWEHLLDRLSFAMLVELMRRDDGSFLLSPYSLSRWLRLQPVGVPLLSFDGTSRQVDFVRDHVHGGCDVMCKVSCSCSADLC